MRRIIFITVLILIAAIAFAQQMRDPTRPPNVSTVSDLLPTSKAVLSILISGHRKLVYIGNRYLGVGDEYLGEKIIDIKPDAIYLEGRNGVITIPLSVPQLKSAANKGEKK